MVISGRKIVFESGQGGREGREGGEARESYAENKSAGVVQCVVRRIKMCEIDVDVVPYRPDGRRVTQM